MSREGLLQDEKKKRKVTELPQMMHNSAVVENQYKVCQSASTPIRLRSQTLILSYAFIGIQSTRIIDETAIVNASFRKRSPVDIFVNATFRKRCVLVWTPVNLCHGKS